MNEMIQKVAQAIAQADALLIGASNGLSIAEGYHIFTDNEMFRCQFGDFRQKYGIHNVIEGCFYRYPSETHKSIGLAGDIAVTLKELKGGLG